MSLEIDRSITLRREIIEIARIVFNQKGFDDTSVLDVAERVNISEQKFTNYFRSLDELLEVVWSE